MEHLSTALFKLFFPLVCLYSTLSTNLFLNVSIETATGLEKISNTLLIPSHYLFAGKKATLKADGSWEISQRFEYQSHFWLKTTASIAALPPAFVLGCVTKTLSFLDPKTQERQKAVRSAMHSKKIHSNASFYKQIGMNFEDASLAEKMQPQGYLKGAEDHSLKVEKEALKEIATRLNQANIAWWADCGTCLGAYRYGGVIPWDEDIDIAILLPDFDNVMSALQDLDPKKYIVQDWSSREHPKSYIKVFCRQTLVPIDIYFFAIDVEKKQIRYLLSLENNLFLPQWWKIRERRFKAPVSFDTVFPLKKATLDGIDIFVPNDAEKYLQRYYGENLAPAKIYNPVTGLFEKDMTHPYWERLYAH